MVIDDSDMVGASVFPGKTYSPLIIDADAELTSPVTFQRFEPVARRKAKVRKNFTLIEQAQFSQSNILHAGGSFRLRLPDQINFVS
jgi:hypothetical protein